MAHVLEVAVPDDLVDLLDIRASQAGMNREDYISDLLRRNLQLPRTLDEILAPLREQVRTTGIDDEELTRLFQAARDDAAAGKHHN